MKRLLVVLFALLACAPAWAGKKPLYTYFRVGNPNDIVTAVSPGIVLMGGGTDVDAAFQWMCDKAGNGDFLVIRATGTDAYNPYIQDLCPAANSVATLIIPSIAAANAISLDIRGEATHPHMVEVTQQDLRNLQSRQAVAKTSSTDNGHQHGVTFTPM